MQPYPVTISLLPQRERWIYEDPTGRVEHERKKLQTRADDRALRRSGKHIVGLAGKPTR